MIGKSITKTQYKVSDFINWQKSKLLVLVPKFQRRAVWSAGAKSYLIDTIIKDLPIPIVFLRARKTDLKTLDNIREVVDGQQRIRTVLSFVVPQILGKQYDPRRDSFQIKSTHNKDYANKDFADLPKEIKQAIVDYEFSVHVLPSSISDREVIQIFARMNSTGFKLNEQELRNAGYFGEFKTSMFRIAAEQLQRWNEWGIFNWDAIARMQEVELTSEFAQFMWSGIVGKSQKAITNLYDDYDESFPRKSEIEHRFRTVMDKIDEALGIDLAASQFSKRTLFYGLFAAFYDALFGIGSALRRKKARNLPREFVPNLLRAAERIASGRAPARVLGAVARRTTHLSSRRILINYLKKSTGLA